VHIILETTPDSCYTSRSARHRLWRRSDQWRCGTDSARHAQTRGVSVSQGRVRRPRDRRVDILISIVTTTIYSASLFVVVGLLLIFDVLNIFFRLHLVFGYYTFFFLNSLTRFTAVIFHLTKFCRNAREEITMQNFAEHSSNAITKPTNSKSILQYIIYYIIIITNENNIIITKHSVIIICLFVRLSNGRNRSTSYATVQVFFVIFIGFFFRR